LRSLTASLGLLLLSPSIYAAAPERPPIVGIANIAVKVKDLEAARNFYFHVLGYQEAFTIKQAKGSPDLICFKVNERQYIEISPELKDEAEDRLIHIAFETKDARKLRDYLASKQVAVPSKVGRGPDGNFSFEVKDPDGHTVQFVQYMPGSVTSRNAGKFLSDARLSDHIIHVGIHIADSAASDRFYQDILGFRLQWKGGPTDARFDWISMLVPEGSDWVEYMANNPHPTPQQLGVMHHLCLNITDIQAAYKTVMERGYKPPRAPNIARDGRWLCQLYDPNLTRTELMVRKPVQTPCCSPMHDVDTVSAKRE
jgi:catechol 2,3-dioxygenase-like lactoylglutathione lyase family enzyme